VGILFSLQFEYRAAICSGISALRELNPAMIDFSSRLQCLLGIRVGLIKSIMDYVYPFAEERVFLAIWTNRVRQEHIPDYGCKP